MIVVYCRNCECCEGRYKSEKICKHRKNLTGKDWYEYGTPAKLVKN